MIGLGRMGVNMVRQLILRYGFGNHLEKSTK